MTIVYQNISYVRNFIFIINHNILYLHDNYKMNKYIILLTPFNNRYANHTAMDKNIKFYIRYIQ